MVAERSRRPRRLLLGLAFTGFAFVLLVALRTAPAPSKRWLRKPAQPLAKADRYGKLTRGQWQPKPHAYLEADLEAEWGSQWWACQRDYHQGWQSLPIDERVKGELAQRRTLRLASLDWHSELGVLPWNGTEFIMHALNSEDGILFIGGPFDRDPSGSTSSSQTLSRSRPTTC